MVLFLQIAIGAGLLILCALIHVAVVVLSIPALRRIDNRYKAKTIRHDAAVLASTVFALLLGHTIQVWLWAGLFLFLRQFDDMPTSIYFTIVTYTTLGYGDIVLDPYARIVASFASITGLLTFGISTAVVLAVLGRLLPVYFGDTTNR